MKDLVKKKNSPGANLESRFVFVLPENKRPQSLLNILHNNQINLDTSDTSSSSVLINEVNGLLQAISEDESNLTHSLETLLQNSYSFYLKFDGWSCWPNYTISSVSPSPLPKGSRGKKIKCRSSKRTPFSCWFPLKSFWQTISFFQDDDDNDSEKLNFIYKPQVFQFCEKKRVVDIYIPERNERIGWIRFQGGFADGAEIVCTATNETFITRRIDDIKDSLALEKIQIENAIGLPVAVGCSTRGNKFLKVITWNGFQMEMSNQMVSSPFSRAILLVAFSMWVIDYKETTTRVKFYVWILLILFCTFIASGITFLHFSLTL